MQLGREVDHPHVRTLTYTHNGVPEWSKRSTAVTSRSQLIRIGVVHRSARKIFTVSSGVSQHVNPYVTWDAKLLRFQYKSVVPFGNYF